MRLILESQDLRFYEIEQIFVSVETTSVERGEVCPGRVHAPVRSIIQDTRDPFVNRDLRPHQEISFR